MVGRGVESSNRAASAASDPFLLDWPIVHEEAHTAELELPQQSAFQLQLNVPVELDPDGHLVCLCRDGE